MREIDSMRDNSDTSPKMVKTVETVVQKPKTLIRRNGFRLVAQPISTDDKMFSLLKAEGKAFVTAHSGYKELDPDEIAH